MNLQFETMKIGNKCVMLSYEFGTRHIAQMRLQEQKRLYDKACVDADMDPYEMVGIIIEEHEAAEKKKLDICPKCGYGGLKERRDRTMYHPRGWFGAWSEVWPYSHCNNCGNDVETPTASYISGEEAMRRARRRIENAKKIKEEYE